jgi:uncharacterized protein involved in tellurium resistance
MGVYDLTQLLDWARRTGGDRLQTAYETITADGTRRITLGNEGAISLVDLEEDDVEADTFPDINGNLMVFPSGSIPAEGTELYVTYNYTTYSDDDVMNFMADSAHVVLSALGANHWDITDSFSIQDDGDGNGQGDVMYNINGEVDHDLERLIVFRTAMAIYEDKNYGAADGAIKIKDRDTAIDTSVTSESTRKVLARLQKQFEDTLLLVRNRRFTGMAIGFDEFHSMRHHRRPMRLYSSHCGGL